MGRAIDEIVATTPNVIVDGDVRNVEDIDAVEGDGVEGATDVNSDDTDPSPRADAHLAVGLLAGARQEAFNAGDVFEVIDHTDAALDITTDETACRRLERVRATLDGVTDVDAEERNEQLANVLSELASVAAGVVGRESSLEPTYRDRFPQPSAGEVPSLLKDALTAHPDEQPYFIRQAWHEFARAYEGVEGPPLWPSTVPHSTPRHRQGSRRRRADLRRP